MTVEDIRLKCLKLTLDNAQGGTEFNVLLKVAKSFSDFVNNDTIPEETKIQEETN